MPAQNTYRRVLEGAVDVAALQVENSRFLSETLEGEQSVLIAFDGKTMRRFRVESSASRPTHC